MNPFKKFEEKLKNLQEDNSAGDGGAFGTPAEMIYNPNHLVTGDTYARGDARNLFMGGGKNGKNKTKKTPIIRRAKIENLLDGNKKKKS